MNKTLLLTSASAFALMLGLSATAYADDGARASATGTSSGNSAYDDGSQRDNLIEDSFNGGATGIVHDQQNNGSNNVINAATAVHADVTGGTSLVTGASATSDSDGNYSDHEGDGEDRRNRILGTMNGFVGSATIQQNNGDNNAINAATALDGVAGDATGVEQNADASSTASNNVGDEIEDLALDRGSDRLNLINPSFNGAAGVYTVQQNNGSGNAISAATAALGITGDAGGLDQDVSAQAEADNNGSIGFEVDRENQVFSSFNNGFAGVATVQQNNGDNNAISAATAVAGVGGNAGDLTQHAVSNGFGDGAMGNFSVDHWSWRTNELGSWDGSNKGVFKGAHGVATVQQNNGDNNAVSAANAVAAHVGAAGTIHQGVGVALGFSGAAGNGAVDVESFRHNGIFDGSFNNASGAFTVQQNNGDANSMGAATAVAGITGDTDDIDQHARNGMFLTGSGWNGDEEKAIKDISSDRKNTIKNSMNGMSGVVTVQQNNGNANNIGAGTGMIGVGGTSGRVDQAITAGTGYSGSGFNNTEADHDDRENLIDPAFTGHEGIATVQQNNGDANNMVALTTVTMTNGAGKVVQDLSADNVSLDNEVTADKSERYNRIENSFDGLKGVATVQQNNGDANSIVALTGAVVVNGDSGKTVQRIDALGASEGNETLDEGKSERGNMIDPSFDNVEGVLTVQQNNGSGNAITAATGIVANTGGANDTKQTVKAGGHVEGNDTLDKKSGRDNTITDRSFRNMTGIATVQQNNGDGNVMSASTGVALNTGDGKLDDVKQKVKTNGSVVDARAKDVDNTDFHDGERLNTLNDRSFNGTDGIVTVQQNNGDNNVIAAATGVRAELNSTISSSPGEDDVSRQLASTKGTVKDSNARTVDKEPDDVSRANDLTNAFKGGVNGVFTVQQNNGDNNVIGSSIALAADINTADDLDSAMDNDAKTTGKVKGNWARDKYTERLNTIDGGVFNGAAGIITVQQNNGSNNVMGSATGVVANVETGFHYGSTVEADAAGEAKVKNNEAIAEDVIRNNFIDNTMIGTQGIMTLQQNNGDNNVMGSAVEVVVTTELPGFGPATSMSSLAATVSGNTATWDADGGSSYLNNSLTSAFTGASGVMTIQQNNGNNNAIQSAVTVVANGISFGFNP